jgi:hypothetical protein
MLNHHPLGVYVSGSNLVITLSNAVQLPVIA